MQSGVRLGPYEILSPLGAGGMGEVYRARDTRLGREVAVKLLRTEVVGDAERVRRFEQEARAVASLSHPNILALYDVGTHQGRPYLVTELLEGQTLAEQILSGDLTVGKAVEFATQIAQGLAAAHERGIVHRDLKPGNVFATRDGVVKILDFGLARPTQSASVAWDPETSPTETGMTRAGAVLGTVGYMAPEQVRGLPADERSDIFAFGCVLYEMLSGQRAFQGSTPADTLSAILTEDPPPLSDLRRSVSPALQQLVDRCLEKRPEGRFSSAHDLALALRAVASAPAEAPRQAEGPGAESVVTAAAPQSASRRAQHAASIRVHRRWWLLGGLAVLAVVAVATPWIVRQRRLAWVREQALPELVRLADAREYWPAFLLARKIEEIVPDESTLEKLRPRYAGEFKRAIRPAGATVLARSGDGGESDWVELGEVGEAPLSAPLGYSVFRVQAEGHEPLGFAMSVSETGWDTITIGGAAVLTARGEGPDGMVRIEPPENDVDSGLARLAAFEFAQAVRLGGFFADIHEVTNREYKAFVDAGGYQRRVYWRVPFEKEGRTLDWEEAMALLRDATGRPGPAAWEIGTFPEGTADHPVTGVSWYEAAAYAAFVGKRLPSVYHFAVASAHYVGGDFLPGSNFSGELAPAGSFRGGLNYWGLMDAAGNAREWCSNEAAGERFVLGGACDGPAYMFWNPDATRPPFDRDPTTGFRCIRPVVAEAREEPLDAAIARRPPVDWAALEGFSEDAWSTWLGFLSYPKGALDARVEWRDDTLPSWRIEKVTFNAAYGPNERVVAYLYLPDESKTPPPWQAVVYYPPGMGYSVSSSQEGRNTLDMSYYDYLVHDGRAVVFPIFKGTFERGGGAVPVDQPGMTGLISPAKDVFRTIDYLETRDDIQADRIAFLGLSAGADAGTMVCAVEKRIRAAVFLGCGLYGDALIDRGMIGFSRRLATPVLMINGRFDCYVSQPVFEALATPGDLKRQVQFDADHTLAGYEKEVKKATLAWLDRFLGPVR